MIPNEFDAWLHRLTVNSCLDAVRRRKRRPIEVELSPIMSPTIGDETGAVADRDQLERGFRRLRADLRAVLVLHYYVGMSASAVAETLDIPRAPRNRVCIEPWPSSAPPSRPTSVSRRNPGR